MSYQCVVGGCLQKEDKVERCHLNQGGTLRKEHAYLDLCWFHQEFFATQMETTIKYGWDPMGDA